MFVDHQLRETREGGILGHTFFCVRILKVKALYRLGDFHTLTLVTPKNALCELKVELF